MRTAGRIFAGLFLGAVLYFGFGGAAMAQTPTPSPSPNPTPTSAPTSSTATTASSTTLKVGGNTLPKTGIDMTVPLGIGGAALAITVVLRRVLANG